MAKTACKVAAVLGMVAAGLAGTASSAFGTERELLAMRVLVHTVADGPRPEMLVRAQAETARMFAAVGVELVWEVGSAPILPSDPLSLLSRLTMLIISNPNAWLERVAATALGAAPAGDRGARRLAYAFHDRIQQSARRYGTDPAKILGYVMAHELGHLLLARGHSFTGIMSAGWDRYQMLSVEMSLLRFTNEQARLIRTAVAEMNTDRRRQAGIVEH